MRESCILLRNKVWSHLTETVMSHLHFIFLAVCRKIYGKWVLHVASWDDPGLKDDILSVNSSWLDVSASSESGVITIYWADRL